MTKVFVPVAITLVYIGLYAPPAAANEQEKSVFHVDETYTDSRACSFDLTVHLDGSFYR